MTPVFALSFVHPGILGGLALAGLPILIHILNRRRFKSMEWAAMDFLLKAAVRNRRRVRLENLLLLALRTALVLLLVLAVARPFTRRDDALASLFGAEGVTERILLLDDSHSMRAGQGNRSSFDRAKKLVRAMLERLHEEKSGDRVTIVLASRPRQGGEGFARVAVASSQVRRMERALDGLRVSDGVFDVAGSLDAVLEAHGDKEARLVLHVVSDFRRRDWTEADGSLKADVVRALERFSARGEVRLLDVGASPVQNVGVVALAPAERAVVAGVPATFIATIRNHGPETIAHPVSVEFGFGTTRISERLEGPLEPGHEADVKLEYVFREPGFAVVSARTPTDVLPGDDTRRRVVEVRKAMRFLLVDGEPELEAYRSETDFLAAALMPPGETDSGVRVDVVTEHAFSGRDLEFYDGVFLCNVYRLPEDRVKRLEEFVAAGGGLVFFLGDQVDPRVYNSLFLGRGANSGKGLLPLRLRDVAGEGEGFVNFTAPSFDHPVTRLLRGVNAIVFRTASIRRFVQGDVPAAGGARVVLSYSDDQISPALVDKSFGDGRVLLFTTAADLEWSDFPRSVLYVLLMQECARYVVRPDPAAYTLPVGAPITIPFDPAHLGPRVMLVPPPELGGAPVALRSTKDEKTKRLYYRFDETYCAGTYTARLQTPEGDDYTRPYAFNVEPAEGDLRRADLGAVMRAVPGLRLQRAGDEAALLDTDRSDRSEFWRTLLWVLIAVATVETLLAWRFGHHKAHEIEAEGKQVFVR